MIFSKTDYNPFPAITTMAGALGRANYSNEFFDLVLQELFRAGVVPENQEEAEGALRVLMDMDVI